MYPATMQPHDDFFPLPTLDPCSRIAQPLAGRGTIFRIPPPKINRPEAVNLAGSFNMRM